MGRSAEYTNVYKMDDVKAGLSKKLSAQLTAYCDATDLPKSEVVRNAVAWYLRQVNAQQKESL